MGDLSRLEIEQRRQYWQGEQKARSMLQHYDPRLPLQGDALAERARIDEEYEQAKEMAARTAAYLQRRNEKVQWANYVKANAPEGAAQELIALFTPELLDEPQESLDLLLSARDQGRMAPDTLSAGGFSEDEQTYRTPATHYSKGPTKATNVPEALVDTSLDQDIPD